MFSIDAFIRVLNILQREARIRKVFSITLLGLDCPRLSTCCCYDKFPGHGFIIHVFKGKILSPTQKYGSRLKEQLLTVLGGRKSTTPDSNCFLSLEFSKRPLSLLLPYCLISVRLKQYLASQTASKTKLKNPL